MSKDNKAVRREYDLRQGPRTLSIGVRFTPAEVEYIDKIAKKNNLARAAVISLYFNNHKESLGH